MVVMHSFILPQVSQARDLIIYGPYYHPTVWFQSRGEEIPATGVKIAEKLKLKCQIEVDLKNENPLLEEVEDNLKGYLVLFKPLE